MRETATKLGLRLKMARERAGISQVELAVRIGKGQAAVSQWEHGRRLPGIEDLVKMSEVLGVSPAALLPEAATTRAGGLVLLRAVLDTLQMPELDRQLRAFLEDAEGLPQLPELISVPSDRPARAVKELLSRGAENGIAATLDEPRVPIDRLAELCGVHVLPRRFEDGLSGLLVTLEQGAAIGVNDQHSRGRQRFTVAHELGHYLLAHYDRFHLDLPTAEAGESPSYDWRLEQEANRFAADVLMPAALLELAHRQVPQSAVLATRFGVSEVAMGYRLINLGLAQP